VLQLALHLNMEMLQICNVLIVILPVNNAIVLSVHIVHQAIIHLFLLHKLVNYNVLMDILEFLQIELVKYVAQHALLVLINMIIHA